MRYWTIRTINAASAVVIAGFGVTVVFGFLPPETPLGVRVAGMLLGLFGIAWAARQGVLWTREKARGQRIAAQLDDLIHECELAFNNVLAARTPDKADVFRKIQTMIGECIEGLFGADERDLLLTGAPRRNAYIDHELPAGEYHTSIVAYERRIERLRSRVLDGRLATSDGFRVPV